MLACLLVPAVWYDIVNRRIPNRLITFGLIAGIVVNVVGAEVANFEIGGMSGLFRALSGGIVGLLILLPLYLFRAMGAGDVKLMATIGVFLGPMPTLGAALLAFVAGGVLSLGAALWSRSLSHVLANLRLMIMLALSGRSSGLSLHDVQTTGRLPYAIAIAVGTALQLWLVTQETWPFK